MYFRAVKIFTEKNGFLNKNLIFHLGFDLKIVVHQKVAINAKKNEFQWKIWDSAQKN